MNIINHLGLARRRSRTANTTAKRNAQTAQRPLIRPNDKFIFLFWINDIEAGPEIIVELLRQNTAYSRHQCGNIAFALGDADQFFFGFLIKGLFLFCVHVVLLRCKGLGVTRLAASRQGQNSLPAKPGGPSVISIKQPRHDEHAGVAADRLATDQKSFGVRGAYRCPCQTDEPDRHWSKVQVPVPW